MKFDLRTLTAHPPQRYSHCHVHNWEKQEERILLQTTKPIQFILLRPAERCCNQTSLRSVPQCIHHFGEEMTVTV